MPSIKVKATKDLTLDTIRDVVRDIQKDKHYLNLLQEKLNIDIEDAEKVLNFYYEYEYETFDKKSLFGNSLKRIRNNLKDYSTFVCVQLERLYNFLSTTNCQESTMCQRVVRRLDDILRYEEVLNLNLCGPISIHETVSRLRYMSYHNSNDVDALFLKLFVTLLDGIVDECNKNKTIDDKSTMVLEVILSDIVFNIDREFINLRKYLKFKKEKNEKKYRLTPY